VQKLDAELINKNNSKIDKAVSSKKENNTKSSNMASKTISKTTGTSEKKKNVTSVKIQPQQNHQISPNFQINQNPQVSQNSQINHNSQTNQNQLISGNSQNSLNTPKQIMSYKALRKSPEKRRNYGYKESIEEEGFELNESNKPFSKIEENLIETHMNIIRDDARFLTEEGELLTNLKGVGADNEIQMDRYVKVLETIIEKKLNIYSDLKKKMDLCIKQSKMK